jgi:hypothetical protein
MSLTIEETMAENPMIGTTLALTPAKLRDACKTELNETNAMAESNPMIVNFMAGEIAKQATEKLNKMDLLTVIFDALTVYRSIQDAAKVTRKAPETDKHVALNAPKISAPQEMNFAITVGVPPAVMRTKLKLVLNMNIELKMGYLHISKGAITGYDFGNAIVSVELKYRDSVVVPKCETPPLVIGKRGLQKPIVVQ